MLLKVERTRWHHCPPLPRKSQEGKARGRAPWKEGGNPAAPYTFSDPPTWTRVRIPDSIKRFLKRRKSERFTREGGGFRNGHPSLSWHVQDGLAHSAGSWRPLLSHWAPAVVCVDKGLGPAEGSQSQLTPGRGRKGKGSQESIPAVAAALLPSATLGATL